MCLNFCQTLVKSTTTHIFYKLSGNLFVTFVGESICLWWHVRGAEKKQKGNQVVQLSATFFICGKNLRKEEDIRFELASRRPQKWLQKIFLERRIWCKFWVVKCGKLKVTESSKNSVDVQSLKEFTSEKPSSLSHREPKSLHRGCNSGFRWSRPLIKTKI